MAFEGLRDTLKENWADLSSKIQEHPTYNNLREKFESQTPLAQRAIIAGATFLLLLFLLSFPYGYISTSSEYMTQFEENRELIRDLLKVSRSAKTPSPLPLPMDTGMLGGRVDAILAANGLLPDQIGPKAPIPQPAVPEMVPTVVVQNGIAFQLKKLNVTQMVRVANAIQNMGSGVKLMGLDVVQSSGQSHYYDILFKVVHFGLPVVADSEPETGGAKPRPGSKRPARPSANSEEDS